VESAVTTTREPRGKLDVPAAAGANGPEDEALEWRSVDWRRVEGDVRRLRQRIFTASQAGDNTDGNSPALLLAREPSRLA
jgi:RNA-directed DNA polymerase